MSAAEVVANGITTPHIPEQDAPLPPAKRKRASTEDDAPQTNGTSEPLNDVTPTVTKDVSFRDLLADISTVLSNYDTSPSILTFNLSTDPNRSSASGEPIAKRTKLTQEGPATIADKLKEGHYTALDALVKDVESVATALLAPIKAKDVIPYPSPYGRPTTLSSQETRFWTAVLAFQKVLDEIVRAEEQKASITTKPATNGVSKPAEGDSSTPEDTAVKTEVLEVDMLQNGKAVLTVFANAPGPRQLFSSFQQPTNVSGKIASKELNASIDVVTPLRESGLPNFIGTTKIPSMPLVDDPKSKKASTIGALFAPPATLPKLQPPKPSKKNTTTGNTISFVPLDQPTRSGRRNSYNWCAARLSVGQWLGYGGVDSPLEPTSPQAKRKQRDRTLSTGEAYLPPSTDEKYAQQRAKDDALFRKVYGSFAPNHDDSGAIVPEEIRNEIWWNKISDRFAQTSIAIDPALLDEEEVVEVVNSEKEEAEIKEAVESFDPVELGLDKLQEEAKEAKEVDEILEEVSSLLETLSSFQRIRNSSLATSSRTTVGQNNPLTDLTGSPSTPSTAEMEVYKTLKLQLAVLIDSLPPYAVARLNGDQLEELSIKTSIVIESANPRGVMTEDEASRALKQQAFAAAAGPPTLNRAGSSGAYPNYSATPSQYAAHGRPQVPPSTARPTAAAAYFPPPQSQSRPAPLYQRPNTGVQTYSGGYPTTTPRASFPQQGYPQTTPRPSTYQPSSNHHLQNIYNITGQKTNYTQPQQPPQQYYPGTPTTQRQGYAHTSTPASNFQSRPQPPAAPMYNYPAAQSPQVRTASPLTTSASIAPPQYSQPRPAYGTPTTGAPQQNSSYYRPPVTQGGAQYGTPGQANFSQAQQQQRLSVSGVATPSRQASGTPQPPAPVQNGNGNAGGYAAGQVNGTPAPVSVQQAS